MAYMKMPPVAHSLARSVEHGNEMNMANITHRRPRFQTLRRQDGVTLVEVMVALLILGVGLLGIMGMQTTALQHNQQAYLYSQANFAIQDIAERMRANPESADEYQTNLADGAPSVDAEACVSAACDTGELADWDLKLWKDFLAKALPEGKGAIDRVGDEYEITVEFDDSRGEQDPLQVIRVIEI